MDDLIARLEAAMGPDRELDAAIHTAAGLPGSPIATRVVDGQTIATGGRAPLRYTASLDAALTLVPEGWDWHVQANPGLDACWASVGRFQPPGVRLYKHDSPIIALCIAALTARNAARASTTQAGGAS